MVFLTHDDEMLLKAAGSDNRQGYLDVEGSQQQAATAEWA